MDVEFVGQLVDSMEEGVRRLEQAVAADDRQRYVLDGKSVLAYPHLSSYTGRQTRMAWCKYVQVLREKHYLPG